MIGFNSTDKRGLTWGLLLLIAVSFASKGFGQYYSWGADGADLRWQRIKGSSTSVIYPDTADMLARKTLHYIETVKDDIYCGYSYPALDMPFVIHPENFSANALVMWMPKRIDFRTIPATDGFSMPWIKQLVAHEYRHAVQYNNLNKNIIKGASYILGQQGSALGLLFLPVRIIEGDAVFCETSMSTFGRGLQPSFTMGYRAIGRDMLRRKNTDPLYCGSYIDYFPDHYEMGYQIVTYAYTHFQENVWDKVIRYGTRNPYFVCTVPLALKKYYGTNTETLMRDAFNNLFDYWESLPPRENSTQSFVQKDTTNYTTYSHPIAINSDEVIALKEDLKYSSRFVRVKEADNYPLEGRYRGKLAPNEELIAHTGSISTRPTSGGDRLWWSEYRQSKLFEERVYSQLCYIDLDDTSKGKPRTLFGYNNILYPTAIGDSKSHLAFVEYTANGTYSIVEIEKLSDTKSSGRVTKDDYKELSRTVICCSTEVHGLAWDDLTNELYFIATDDSGMWLGARNTKSESGFRQLQNGAYITISDLRAKGGKLYFGSIESGYDELHSYDIASGQEYRLSQSTYGSFDPSTPITSVDSVEYTFATTYDKYGYNLSRQNTNIIESEVIRKNRPQNIVNPERTMLNVVNLDTVKFTPTELKISQERGDSKRYRKGLNLINIHSWFPISIDTELLVEEQQLDVAYGATLLTQNLLSSASGFISYGYNTSQGSIFTADLTYDGLGVVFDLKGVYGGHQIVYTPDGNFYNPNDKYASITTSATLPLLYQRGYHNRQLSLSTSWNYSNGWVDDPRTTNYDFSTGLHKLAFNVGYYDGVTAAKRDIKNPFAYSFNVGYMLSPTCRDFDDLVSLTGSLTTRGLFPYNAFTISAGYQTSVGGYKKDGERVMSFSSIALLPTGYTSTDVENHNYRAAKVGYYLPVWYPDGGIESILYFRRIGLKLGFDVAQFDLINSSKDNFIYSYGGGITMDINPLRMPESSTMSLEISLYRTKSGNFSCQFGMNLPI